MKEKKNLNLINNLPIFVYGSMFLVGYGPAEGRCLPCSGVSGRAVAFSPCSSPVDHRIYSQVKIGSMKCVSRATSFVCKGTSGGHRRNPDFSRQNKQAFSRNRNRQNEERDSFESLDESDLLTSKNGPLLSLSNTTKFQATAAPGPREKEIVELFRKVQAQLRERAAVKEDKKVETSQSKVKENETVNSLLKLLRKHSVEQGKKKISSFSSGDLIPDQTEQNGPYNDKSTNFFNSSNKGRNDVLEPSNSSFNRPASNFRRKSPVPQVKFQPIYSNEDSIDSTSHLNLSSEKKLFEMAPDTAQQLEMEPELEPQEEPESDPEPDLKLESSFSGGDVLDELSEGESSDIDVIDEDDDKQQLIENKDLSTLKLLELRALAKSRGVKGFSKMKKGELVELLSSSSV